MREGIENILLRIAYILRLRDSSLYRKPPTSELEFITITANHKQFAGRLYALDEQRSSQEVQKYARYVGLCWFRLALEHLSDAQAAVNGGSTRSTYSRAYYSAYNASKAVRFVTQGIVSLKGDDHHKASSDLPDDFPDVDKWSQVVTQLYEHRLRADYDNWESTLAEHTISPREAVDLASEFVSRCRSYLSRSVGAPI